MILRFVLFAAFIGALPACVPDASLAGVPFRPFCTCNVTVVQNPPRPQCLDNFAPDVVRLCPDPAQSPAFDTVTFDLVILSAFADPLYGMPCSAYEASGTVNIAPGGSTTDVTDANGRASITVSLASGYGRIAACSYGVPICEIEVRSPDVATSGVPSLCTLPTTGSSFVNASDVTNPSCGFLARFGAVTPGENNWWDLNCDGTVNASDVLGQLAKGGVLQHFGHGAPLGAKNGCP